MSALRLIGGMTLGLAGLLLTAGLSGCGWFSEKAGGVASGSEEEQLCRRFADLKNAGDATANDLLAPAPAVPVERVSNEEADRLDAQFILRNPFQVRKVLASGPKQFVLVVEGGCASEKLPGHGQRWLLNPEIVVTVQNGQILGLSAHVHVER
jgi:hypothetical protein